LARGKRVTCSSESRDCIRAASEWAGVVFVGAEGPMFTVVVDDDDFRYGVVSDG
jgi:hypothetical protein